MPKSPENVAQSAYNTGVRLVEKADELAADAARQTDAQKQKKALDKSRKNYGTALKKFEQAVDAQSQMYTAWNYLGYTNRKLGNYTDALAAYDRALAINPAFAEAIEYRGHAYLGLNRLSEAKEAYLSLYSSNRKLAASLLTGMQEWVGAHRTNSAGIDSAMLDSFASWVNERSKIAGQTVGLTREGAASSWK
jgi:tetratricopeptide (TPR) repeat protein